MPLILGAGTAVPMNLSYALQLDRDVATEWWRRGRGMLWFQHLRRGGGTSLCNLLRHALVHGEFVEERSEACQPEEWKLRDASVVSGHNLTTLATELRLLGGNAFSQEYGALPSRELLARGAARRSMRRWVFVTNIRDPWSRFWSQLRHEMAPCLSTVQALAVCVAGQHQRLGPWWSPTSHIDSVLGVSGFRISASPHIYSDNYYTRMLLNRTDLNGPPLTEHDYEVAKSILFQRMSAVIVVEDFARSALQLACTLGLNLEAARPLLFTQIRPYQEHEAMMDIPTESELGVQDVTAVRLRFIERNRFDYGLYHEAKKLSEILVAKCARQNPDVAALRAAPMVQEVKKAPEPVVASLDDIFGCTNGSLEVGPDGSYVLYCPRTSEQASRSWWSPLGSHKRRAGQKVPGEHCWREGFKWGFCCDHRYGPYVKRPPGFSI